MRDRLIAGITGFVTAVVLTALMSVADSRQRVARDNAHIRALALDALDEALKERIKSLFQVWMRDDTGQPDRAATGARQAIKAYRDATVAMERELP